MFFSFNPRLSHSKTLDRHFWDQVQLFCGRSVELLKKKLRIVGEIYWIFVMFRGDKLNSQEMATGFLIMSLVRVDLLPTCVRQL